MQVEISQEPKWHWRVKINRGIKKLKHAMNFIHMKRLYGVPSNRKVQSRLFDSQERIRIETVEKLNDQKGPYKIATSMYHQIY